MTMFGRLLVPPFALGDIVVASATADASDMLVGIILAIARDNRSASGGQFCRP